MMRALVFPLMFVALALAGGCNTISGLGKDVAATGNAVSSTAEKAKDAMSNPDPATTSDDSVEVQETPTY